MVQLGVGELSDFVPNIVRRPPQQSETLYWLEINL